MRMHAAWVGPSSAALRDRESVRVQCSGFVINGIPVLEYEGRATRLRSSDRFRSIGRSAQFWKFGSGVKPSSSNSKRFYTATVGEIEFTVCKFDPPYCGSIEILFSYESDFGSIPNILSALIPL